MATNKNRSAKAATGSTGKESKPAPVKASDNSAGTGMQDQGAGASDLAKRETGDVEGNTSPKDGHLVGEDPRQNTAQKSEEILSESLSEKKQSIRGYSVVPLQPGFRRAGREWPAGETTLSVDDITEEQLAAIKAEPMLIVSAVFEAE